MKIILRILTLALIIFFGFHLIRFIVLITFKAWIVILAALIILYFYSRRMQRKGKGVNVKLDPEKEIKVYNQEQDPDQDKK
ncbi:MAG: hypothetical protein JXB60_07945 [Candidatus Cloacimonetes bacterium]|nr:hypothetical protein [Candidatus Cloacimonadota bacterium]